MLSPRLAGSRNTQGSPEQSKRKDALCKAVRIRVCMLQTSSCLKITGLLAVSSTAQNMGQLEASHSPARGLGLAQLPGREGRITSSASPQLWLPAWEGRKAAGQPSVLHLSLPCPALALPHCSMSPLCGTQQVPDTAQLASRAAQPAWSQRFKQRT